MTWKLTVGVVGAVLLVCIGIAAFQVNAIISTLAHGSVCVYLVVLGIALGVIWILSSLRKRGGG